MRASKKQVVIARLMREYREHLTATLTELTERDEPVSSLEVRLILEVSEARYAHIQQLLGHAERHRGPLRRRLRRISLRLRSWTRPRIGILYHYPPIPLTVPASYLRVTPPEPAPKISLVTPSFQQGMFLERTMYSVLAQAYPALEYVVQDGGSSDETLDVLSRYDSRLTRWATEPDEGQADAINRGFRGTDGEIMAWLNSDDLLLPGSLAYVAHYFERHPDVDVVYGHRVMIDENDGQIGAWIVPPHDDLALTLADFVPQETLFWRRRIWDAVGGAVDPSFGYALDWDLLLRFRDAGARMVRLPRFLGAFRVHAAQKTTAAEALGQLECDRLRERVHGRPMALEEVSRRLTPYLRRHIFVHNYERALDRLYRPRELVHTKSPLPPVELDRAESLSSELDEGTPRVAPTLAASSGHGDPTTIDG